MEEKKKLIIIVVIFIVFIVISVIAYNYLMKEELSEPKNKEENLQIASDFSVYNIDGEEVKLSDYKGKPIVINFWATWCKYCVEEMPHFIDAIAKYGENVEFLMVNVMESKDVVNKFMAENNFNMSVVFDEGGKVASEYKISGFPTTIFVTEDGKILKRVSGMISEKNLEKNINNLLEK